MKRHIMHYNTENFNYTITLCDDALKKYPQDILAPKFMLLRAYSIARISDERSFKEELINLLKHGPKQLKAKKQWN